MADPLVSNFENSSIHLLQKLNIAGPLVSAQPNQSQIIAIYQNRITASACFRLGSQPNHSHSTHESQPYQHRCRSTATAESQPLRNRRSTCFRLGSQPKHSHVAAGIIAEPQPHHSRIRTGSQPLRNRRFTYFKHGPHPNHGHITLES